MCSHFKPQGTRKSNTKGRVIKPNERYRVLPCCVALKCHKTFYKDKFPLKSSNTVRAEKETKNPIFILYTSYPQRKNTKKNSGAAHSR